MRAVRIPLNLLIFPPFMIWKAPVMGFNKWVLAILSVTSFEVYFTYSILFVYILFHLFIVFYRFTSFLQERAWLGLLHGKKLQLVIYFPIFLIIILQALPSGEKSKCDVGKKPENTSKNRYKTTFPCNYRNP